MTVAEAIDWLQSIEKQHGSKTVVYFDCPACKQAFTPGTLTAKVVLISTGEKKKP